MPANVVSAEVWREALALSELRRMAEVVARIVRTRVDPHSSHQLVGERAGDGVIGERDVHPPRHPRAPRHRPARALVAWAPRRRSGLWRPAIKLRVPGPF